MAGERLRAALVLTVVVGGVGAIGWFGVTRIGWLGTLTGACILLALLGALFRNIGAVIQWVGLAIVVNAVSMFSDGVAPMSAIVIGVVGLVGAAMGWKWSGEHAMARVDPYHGVEFPKATDD